MKTFRRRPVLRALVVTFIAMWILVACGDGPPTSPPAAQPSPPPENLTIRAASGATVSLEGVWRSGCVSPTAAAPGGALRESFTIVATAITIEIETFSEPTCAGGVTNTRTVRLDARLGAERVANLAGAVVPVTRVDGTDLTENEPFKQVFHVDDTEGADRLFHGVFADDGGAVDTDGYPTELFEDFLERQ